MADRRASRTESPGRRQSTTGGNSNNGSQMVAPSQRSTEITRFRVFSRVRPFIAEELAQMQEGTPLRSIVEMQGNRTIILDPKEEWAPKSQFEFDASIWSIPPTQKLIKAFADTDHSTHTTQQEVYNMVAKGMVDDGFEGYNSSILTYGQTGSGKTYTMMGHYSSDKTCGGDGEEGVIPRVCNDLFASLDQKRKEEAAKPKGEQWQIDIEVSFVEIYMEKVRDLLDPKLKRSASAEMKEARIRQDPNSGPFIDGVTKYKVENWSQCVKLLERGSLHRTTMATLVHQQSSRSHAIFQLTVLRTQTIPPKDRFSDPIVRTSAGRINLVDLAGSERGGTTDYVKESAKINASLLSLRRVIDNLVERQNILMEQAKQEVTGGAIVEKPMPQVPFRDSVLTWLLSDSIGGNAKTTMIATLSPLAKNFGDTLATLQWSSKARNLVTVVKTNDPQAMVTDGMNTKANEMQSSLFIQRQNMDSLRDVLKAKTTHTEELEKDTEGKRKGKKVAESEAAAALEEAAVLRAQRFVRRWQLRRRINTLEGELAASTAALATAEGLRDEQQTVLEERLAEQKASQKSLDDEKALRKKLEKEIADAKKNRQKFEARKVDVSEKYDMLQSEFGDMASEGRKQIEKQKDQLEVIRGETATVRKNAATLEKEVVEMEQFVQEYKMTDAEVADGTAKATKESEELAKKIAELTKKRDQVKKKRDDRKAYLEKAKKK